MLLSHLLILSLVCVTINGQACPVTSKAGATTTKAGATTSKAGATTTKAGATTAKAGATTAKAGATTAKAGATTSKAGTTTAKAGTTTAKAGTTTAKAGTTTAKAGATTSKAGATTAKAGTTTAKAGTTTTKAGTTTTKAGTTTTKAGTTTAKAGATTTKAGTTTTKAGTTTTKAGTTTTKAGATTTKASINDNGACSNISIIDGSLTDCKTIFRAGCKESGIYKITPDGWTEGPFEAYCDMEKLTVPNLSSCNARGWTVFQRRVNGSVDFHRNWASYKDGFGQLDHEFWLGNEKLHYLAKENDGKHRLQIYLVSNSGTTYHACYDEFYIKNEGEQYKLHVARFFGTNSLSDGLSYQYGTAFSTSDMDNTGSTNNCADITQGGWWHKACNGDYTNLNGVYGSNQDSTSINWKGLPIGESIIFSEMKIRRCTTCN